MAISILYDLQGISDVIIMPVSQHDVIGSHILAFCGAQQIRIKPRIDDQAFLVVIKGKTGMSIIFN